MESMPAVPTVRRSLSLGIDRAAAWSAVADPDGLAGWLAASVELDVATGAAGRLVDHDGTVRRLVVTDVVDGERLAFTWWSETDPADASSVVISLDGGGVDEVTGTTISIVETRDPGCLALVGALGDRAARWEPTSVSDVAGVERGWDDRVVRLLGVVAPAHLTV